MKFRIIKICCFILGIVVCSSLISCNEKKGELEIAFPEKFEGKSVEIISFLDSVLLANGELSDGKLNLTILENDSIRFPLFSQVLVDGRVRAFYIVESGKAVLVDSLNVAKGTALNDEFSSLMIKMDSVEDLDDLDKYVSFAEELYNGHVNSPYREYFGIEWLKYASPEKVDSFLNVSPDEFKNSSKVRYYENFAKHRALTSPGNKYSDIIGEDYKGRKQTLSSMMVPGNFTLIDFWASWCPYCIKELPELVDMYNEFSERGLDIVGVAVRDKLEDTYATVVKKEIPWKILYNTQRSPYDIYGFSGIPHHILLDGNGIIISRGENVSQIRQRLNQLLQ